MHPPDIRRHPDGSPDLDFYRRRARRLHARTRREFIATHAEQIAKVLVAATVIAVSIHLVPARDGTGWNGTPAAGMTQGYALATSLQRR